MASAQAQATIGEGSTATRPPRIMLIRAFLSTLNGHVRESARGGGGGEQMLKMGATTCSGIKRTQVNPRNIYENTRNKREILNVLLALISRSEHKWMSSVSTSEKVTA